MKPTRWMVAAVVAISTSTACAARSSLNTPGGTCFRALAVAADAVDHKGSLVGVRHIQTADLVARVPAASSLGHQEVCGIAYKAMYRPGDVAGADPSSTGPYALILVDTGQRVVAAYVLNQLPLRFSHRV